MNNGACSGKGRGTCVRTREAEYLMARADELLNDCGADEAGSPSDKDAQSRLLVVWARSIPNQATKLTGHPEFDKTEMVSALLDYRRLSPVASLLNAYETFPICRPKAAHRRAA
jgi:hypothetical protein